MGRINLNTWKGQVLEEKKMWRGALTLVYRIIAHSILLSKGQGLTTYRNTGYVVRNKLILKRSEVRWAGNGEWFWEESGEGTNTKHRKFSKNWDVWGENINWMTGDKI